MTINKEFLIKIFNYNLQLLDDKNIKATPEIIIKSSIDIL